MSSVRAGKNMPNSVPIESCRVVLAQTTNGPAIGLVIGVYGKAPLPQPGPYYLIRIKGQTCIARYPTILQCPAVCPACNSSKWWWEEDFTVHCFVCSQPPASFLEVQWRKMSETMNANPELRARLHEENIPYVLEKFDEAVLNNNWPEIQRIVSAVTMAQRLPELLEPDWE